MDAMQALGIAAVFAVAGAVKGVTGMGLPTVAVSLLTLWMPPAHAAALLVMPSLVTNLSQCQGPCLRELSGRLWPMWLAMAGFTIWTPDMGGVMTAGSAHRLLGVVLVMYGILGLWRSALPSCPDPPGWLCAMVGSATGCVIASTSIFVLPMVPFLQSLRLCKEAMVQALGLSFTVATVALAVRMRGEIDLLISVSALTALCSALVGLQAGTRLRACVSAAGFQRLLFVVLIALGAANVLHGGLGDV